MSRALRDETFYSLISVLWLSPGTHPVQLSTGDYLHFYAAATPVTLPASLPLLSAFSLKKKRTRDYGTFPFIFLHFVPFFFSPCSRAGSRTGITQVYCCLVLKKRIFNLSLDFRSHFLSLPPLFFLFKFLSRFYHSGQERPNSYHPTIRESHIHPHLRLRDALQRYARRRENKIKKDEGTRSAFNSLTVSRRLWAPGSTTCKYSGERKNVIFMCSATPVPGQKVRKEEEEEEWMKIKKKRERKKRVKRLPHHRHLVHRTFSACSSALATATLGRR